MPRSADPDERVTAKAVGARLRAARIARGASLRSVASALGVSPSLLSLVENGKTRPSIGTLTALVEHLGLTLDELLPARRAAATPPPSRNVRVPSVQRRGTGPVAVNERGVRWERLSTLGEDGVEPYLVTYAPGASDSPGETSVPRKPPGFTAGFEYAYLISGELTVHLGRETVLLRAGDALNVALARPHSYRNEGSVPACGLWFLVAGQEHPVREQGAAPPR